MTYDAAFLAFLDEVTSDLGHNIADGPIEMSSRNKLLIVKQTRNGWWSFRVVKLASDTVLKSLQILKCKIFGSNPEISELPTCLISVGATKPRNSDYLM